MATDWVFDPMQAQQWGRTSGSSWPSDHPAATDDLPHDAPLLAAMAAARQRRSEAIGEAALSALLADAWDEGHANVCDLAPTLCAQVGHLEANPYRSAS